MRRPHCNHLSILQCETSAVPQAAITLQTRWSSLRDMRATQTTKEAVSCAAPISPSPRRNQDHDRAAKGCIATVDFEYWWFRTNLVCQYGQLVQHLRSLQKLLLKSMLSVRNDLNNDRHGIYSYRVDVRKLMTNSLSDFSEPDCRLNSSGLPFLVLHRTGRLWHSSWHHFWLRCQEHSQIWLDNCQQLIME